MKRRRLLNLFNYFFTINFIFLFFANEAMSANHSLTEEKDKNFKVYLVGAGIASLSAAAYLIKDGEIDGKNIYILEQSSVTGGSLDGAGSVEKGYSLRGHRLFNEEAYTATYDLLSFIPSLTDSQKTVKQEFFEFNENTKTIANARLVGNDRKIIDAYKLGLSWKDKLNLTKLLLLPENIIGSKRIDHYFGPEFFKTNFWILWATTFAFQPWHSAVELKRYGLRFIYALPRLHNLTGLRSSPYNQYDSIVLPITTWLQNKGVNFIMNAKVTNMDFRITDDNKKTTERIHYKSLLDNQNRIIDVEDNDLVIATVGSMTESTDCGSNTVVPKLKTKKDGGAWVFWENIAKNNPEFGKPTVFDDRINESKWESFTVTLKDSTFSQLLEEFTGNKPGTGGVISFKDSNWLMSISLAKQPYFINQPADVTVLWGYALFPDKVGNFVKKKMSESTGEEILTELLGHLKFEDKLELIKETSICIPCMMPFVTSQFLTRKKSDRPNIIPDGTKNIALIGQYSEIPDDTVFTVDYSVRGGQMAAYSLLHLNKKPSPIYKGQYDPRVIIRAIEAMFR